jgi:hypothetical protein
MQKKGVNLVVHTFFLSHYIGQVLDREESIFKYIDSWLRCRSPYEQNPHILQCQRLILKSLLNLAI